MTVSNGDSGISRDSQSSCSALNVCANLSEKLHEAHDSLAFLAFALGEILEHDSSLARDEQNGLAIHFNKVLDKLNGCKASVDLIYMSLRSREAARRAGDDE